MTAPTGAPRPLRLSPDGRLDGDGLLADPALRRLLNVLVADDEEARVVGGAVRNALLGLPVADIDVATTLLPEAVVRRTAKAGFKPIPTGIAHGTVTVVVGGTPFEVTTLREDVETDGRHAVVRFGRDFRADAQRRDFTFNALSVSLDGLLHDTTGGVADLAAGRVRFIGDASRRIEEDHLRILRFFRFHASYGVGALDGEGMAAAIRHRDALGHLSRERIRAELLKLLAAVQAAPVVRAMDEAGILARILPTVAQPARLARLVVIEAALGTGPDAVLRLAALAHGEPADAGRLQEALRLSKAETRRLAEAAAARDALDPAHPPDAAAIRALVFLRGQAGAGDGVRLAWSGADPRLDAAWDAVGRRLADQSRPDFPLGGDDLLARGIKGRAVGAILKRLQAAWIRAGFPDSPVELTRLLDEAIVAERDGAP